MAKVLGYDCVKDGMMIRQLVGYMPEHDCLPADISATEFVTHMGRMSGLPATAARERAAEALRHVGLHEERYRPIGTYSTGMKQRVKLAQALAGDPRLLLLDEPTNGLDPAGRNAMLELIARIGAEFGIPIVVASHLLGEIERICDGLVAIEAGRLLRADTIGSFTRASQTLLVEVIDGPLVTSPVVADGAAAADTAVADTAWPPVAGDGTALPTAPGRCTRNSPGAACPPGPSSGRLLVPLGDDRTYDVVRDAVAALGLPLSRLERRRHQVEEIFRDGQPDYAGRDQAMEAADAY